MKKCKYHVFYKAKRPPECGCDYCEAKWKFVCEQETIQYGTRRKVAIVTEDCPNPEECEEGCCGYCSEVDDLTEDCVDFMSRNS